MGVGMALKIFANRTVADLDQVNWNVNESKEELEKEII
jgi:hypothetical protein